MCCRETEPSPNQSGSQNHIKMILETSNAYPTKSHTLIDGSVVEISNQRIAIGGMGSVYLAMYKKDSCQPETVVVKSNDNLQPADALTVLEEESKIYNHVPEHINITKYLGCLPISENTKNSFIVLEYLPLSLREAICRGGVLRTFKDVLMVLGGVVEGLIHLHKHHVVHFDLKPSNIMLAEDKTPKIADFGISKIRLDNSITAASQGTKVYMAPELRDAAFLNGIKRPSAKDYPKRRVTDSVDIFSFGMIAYVCVAGGKIPNKETSARLISEGKSVWCGGYRTFQVACDSPEKLRSMIQKCLQFDSQKMDTKDFGRPTACDLKGIIAEMMEEKWVDWKLPKIEGSRFQ